MNSEMLNFLVAIALAIGAMILFFGLVLAIWFGGDWLIDRIDESRFGGWLN